MTHFSHTEIWQYKRYDYIKKDIGYSNMVLHSVARFLKKNNNNLTSVGNTDCNA